MLRGKAIQAVVEPIPPVLLKRLDEPCGSRSGQVAYASKELYAVLKGHEGVSILWPRERRLSKGKGRETLVIWVEAVYEELGVGGRVIYVPHHLLPQHTTPPISVDIYTHSPIPLTSVILQPIIEEGDTPTEVDLTSLVNAKPNGTIHHERIIREGEILALSNDYRVLMLEPVRQGICTLATQFTVSSKPYIRSVKDQSDTRTNISLDDFDPDAFLSSSLSLQPVDGDAYGSSTSGSLTPRPGLIPMPEADGPSFTAKRSEGGEEVCWVGVGGLGRAGIFEGDWVIIKGEAERLVKVLAWERLDEESGNTLLLPSALFRVLGAQVTLSPTPFGSRQPTLPMAKTVTIARIATTEGVDKRYERSWLSGLRQYFQAQRLVRRGDLISVPIWIDRPVNDEDEDERSKPTSIAYFTITSLSFDPLVPLEEDFRSSVSSKARAGELGVWADESTRMVLTGVERGRVEHRRGDLLWHDIDPPPVPFFTASARLRDLLSACISRDMHLSVLLKGARGSGKASTVRYLADELGYNVVQVDCFDIVGDASTLQGTLAARVEKARSVAPSILLLHHIEALSKKSESTATGRPPTIVKVIEDTIASLKMESCILIGTCVDPDVVPGELLGVFKQDISISAPNESERKAIAENLLYHLSLDVTPSAISAQTAALHAGDIKALIEKARRLALLRAPASSTLAGLNLTSADITSALSDARSAYSDSIGAPKIPNVTWDDIGGLAGVKDEILETIQLPLDHPELFVEGLKKRSGILLYGPPGTGKTLLAKAVATSCSLNFFSVKGPELLNMYIGESEANVRRVFQRARDAAPCVVFMDELDSVAPKRGNQGDSGGVMDRIVSQLLAELDGMSKGDSGDVYVMGATNRPDLLDSALLRPGRFDRMVYLSPPQSREEQRSILSALTRKFNLQADLDLSDVVGRCGFNLTGADFYALASDAMLCAMTRAAEKIDQRIAHLGDGDWPNPLTPQYYLERMATKEETQVVVGLEDFVIALERLRPSVSDEEMRHYERVQGEFRGSTMNGH